METLNGDVAAGWVLTWQCIEFWVTVGCLPQEDDKSFVF
jgi:hypothetical protein